MSIGEILATARQESGLSVEDVSRETRIRGGLIRAIETDDFRPCGGDVYARGHIRSIAAIVGVDPGPLVAEYDRAHGGAPQPVENPTPTFDPEVAHRSERRRPNWAAAMAVVLVGICVVAGINLAMNTGSGGASEDGSRLQTIPTVSASPPGVRNEPSPEPSDRAVALVPSDGVSVRLRLVGRSWLHVVDSQGQVLFEGILDKGALRDYSDARRIRMTIGNAGAVALVVNGRDVGLVGPEGAVVNRSFGPGSSAGNAG